MLITPRLHAEPDYSARLWSRPDPTVEAELEKTRTEMQRQKALMTQYDRSLAEGKARMAQYRHTPPWASSLLPKKIRLGAIGLGAVLTAPALGITLLAGTWIGGIGGGFTGLVSDQTACCLLAGGFLSLCGSLALADLGDSLRHKYNWLKRDIQDLSSRLKSHRQEGAATSQQYDQLLLARTQAASQIEAQNLRFQELQEALRNPPPPSAPVVPPGTVVQETHSVLIGTLRVPRNPATLNSVVEQP